MTNLDAASADTLPPCRSELKSSTEAGTAGRGPRAGEVWDDRITLLTDHQVTSEMLALAGNPVVKFMNCLPSFHGRDTEVGEALWQRTVAGELEVTSSVLVEPLHCLRPGREPAAHRHVVLVATLTPSLGG